MLDSVGVRKTPYGIVVLVVIVVIVVIVVSVALSAPNHRFISPPKLIKYSVRSFGKLKMTRLWHSERSEESHVDALGSNLWKSTPVIISALTLYLGRPFDRLRVTVIRHSERSEESHGDAVRIRFYKSGPISNSTLILYLVRSFDRLKMTVPLNHKSSIPIPLFN